MLSPVRQPGNGSNLRSRYRAFSALSLDQVQRRKTFGLALKEESRIVVVALLGIAHG